MISLETLIEKRDYYETKKAEITAKDFTADIQKEVDDFKAVKAKEIEDFQSQKAQEIRDFAQSTVSRYESERTEDIKTCNHYIDFANALIDEEKANQEKEQESVSEEDVAESTLLQQ